ncbi:glycosyltransferase [Niveibacterium terrae]|uniref:glycosyltransferase n=1 Tax=Niveibacterium terrae TaxID=3373598 RepID=UPI003A90336C
MKALKLRAFTQGSSVPSARFRVRQYLPQLEAAGIALSESAARFGSYPRTRGLGRLPWLAATLAERSLAALKGNEADLVLFQREMVSTLYAPERLCRVPAVLDVDDAIWLTQRRGAVDKLAARCRLVLCGNAYIAEHFSALAPVTVLPTGVDTGRWTPGESEARPVIVWSGSAGGLPYLYELEDALSAVFEAVPEARLRVVCNAPPRFAKLAADKLEFVPWSAEGEVAAVRGGCVGVMPMPDTPWTRGKCSFKMLTYLACAVPAVASPWGMNAEVIAGGGALAAATPAAWAEALVTLLRDRDRARALGRTGRVQVEAKYAAALIGRQLAEGLRSCL